MVRIWVYPGPQASWRVLVVKTHPLGLVPVSKIYDLDHSGSAPTGFELGLYATLHLRLCGHQQVVLPGSRERQVCASGI